MSALGWTFAVVIVLSIMLGISAFLYIIFRGNTTPPAIPPPAEKNYDPSIPQPVDKLLLLGLPPGNGSPWCIGTYYAMRFVDPKTGNYGLMGPWNPDAVIASPTTPPSSPLPPGGTCGGVVAKIGLNPSSNQSQYYAFNSPYSVNIHRQTGTLDTTKDGDIVGVISPVAFGVGPTTYNYGYIDVDNPATNTNCPKDNNGCPQ